MVLNLFWAWWVALDPAQFILVGSAVCSVCSFHVWARSFSGLARLFWFAAGPPGPGNTGCLGRNRPRGCLRNPASGETADLGAHRLLSSLPAVLITAGAVIAAALREALLVRYLCPVGGMNACSPSSRSWSCAPRRRALQRQHMQHLCLLQKVAPPMGRAWPRRAPAGHPPGSPRGQPQLRARLTAPGLPASLRATECLKGSRRRSAAPTMVPPRGIPG